VQIRQMAHVRILERSGLLFVELWCVRSCDQQPDGVSIEVHVDTPL